MLATLTILCNNNNFYYRIIYALCQKKIIIINRFLLSKVFRLYNTLQKYQVIQNFNYHKNSKEKNAVKIFSYTFRYSFTFPTSLYVTRLKKSNQIKQLKPNPINKTKMNMNK